MSALSSLPCLVSMSLSLNDHFHKTCWCLPMKNIAGKERRITVNLPAVLGWARSHLKWVYVPVVSEVGSVSRCGSNNAYSTRSTIQLIALLLNYRPWSTQNKNWLDKNYLLCSSPWQFHFLHLVIYDDDGLCNNPWNRYKDTTESKQITENECLNWQQVHHPLPQNTI